MPTGPSQQQVPSDRLVLEIAGEQTIAFMAAKTLLGAVTVRTAAGVTPAPEGFCSATSAVCVAVFAFQRVRVSSWCGVSWRSENYCAESKWNPECLRFSVRVAKLLVRRRISEVSGTSRNPDSLQKVEHAHTSELPLPAKRERGPAKFLVTLRRRPHVVRNELRVQAASRGRSAMQECCQSPANSVAANSLTGSGRGA